MKIMKIKVSELTDMEKLTSEVTKFMQDNSDSGYTILGIMTEMFIEDANVGSKNYHLVGRILRKLRNEGKVQMRKEKGVWIYNWKI